MVERSHLPDAPAARESAHRPSHLPRPSPTAVLRPNDLLHVQRQIGNKRTVSHFHDTHPAVSGPAPVQRQAETAVAGPVATGPIQADEASDAEFDSRVTGFIAGLIAGWLAGAAGTAGIALTLWGLGLAVSIKAVCVLLGLGLLGLAAMHYAQARGRLSVSGALAAGFGSLCGATSIYQGFKGEKLDGTQLDPYQSWFEIGFGTGTALSLGTATAVLRKALDYALRAAGSALGARILGRWGEEITAAIKQITALFGGGSAGKSPPASGEPTPSGPASGKPAGAGRKAERIPDHEWGEGEFGIRDDPMQGWVTSTADDLTDEALEDYYQQWRYAAGRRRVINLNFSATRAQTNPLRDQSEKFEELIRRGKLIPLTDRHFLTTESVTNMVYATRYRSKGRLFTVGEFVDWNTVAGELRISAEELTMALDTLVTLGKVERATTNLYRQPPAAPQFANRNLAGTSLSAAAD